MTLQSYLDTAYVLILDQTTHDAIHGTDTPAAITALDETLDAPLARSMTRDELDRAEQQRIARDNEAAHQRLVGFMGMPRAR